MMLELYYPGRILRKLRFVRLIDDPCTYVSHDGEIYIVVYVDDIIIAGKTEKMVQDLI